MTSTSQPQAAPNSCKVALTGFMGCGKSSVGRALAALLGWHFIDLDLEIEQRAGRKIRDIFRREGEPHFRRLEGEALGAVLSRTAPPLVLALGGGTFVQEANAELLRREGVLTVFLDAPLEILIRRCHLEIASADAAARPLAGNLDEFARLYYERLPLYRTADVTVGSDERPATDAARDVALKLGLLG